MYFCCFVITSPWKRAGPFILKKNLSPLHLRMHCAKFCWNWPSGSGEEDENVNSLRQKQHHRQQRTTDKLWSEKLASAFGSGELKNFSKIHYLILLRMVLRLFKKRMLFIQECLWQISYYWQLKWNFLKTCQYFITILLLSPLGKWHGFHLNKSESPAFTYGCFVRSLVEIGQDILENEC